jgi:hypothetical protein
LLGPRVHRVGGKRSRQRTTAAVGLSQTQAPREDHAIGARSTDRAAGEAIAPRAGGA